MSRWNHVCIECDQLDCGAYQEFTAEALKESSLAELLEADGWRVKDGKDACPQCVEERQGD